MISMFGTLNTPWFRGLAWLMSLITSLPGTRQLLLNAQAIPAQSATLADGLLGHPRPAKPHHGDGLGVMILSARLIEMVTPGDHVRQLLDPCFTPLMLVARWPTSPERWSTSAYTWLTRNSRHWSNGIPMLSSPTFFVGNETG